MFNPALALSFTIIFLFSFSNGKSLIDDDMLIAFMKCAQNIQISEYKTEKYEAHLGIVYFLKNNWQCKNINENFGEFERKKCQKFRKYLEIFYEYFFREYVGIPAVKPKFALRIGQVKIECPIIYIINSLNYIWWFFNSEESKNYAYQLNYYFLRKNKPILLNEECLNDDEVKACNEQNLPINEMILQLAIDTANEECPNESVEEIIRQNFDRNLYEMFKKAAKRAQVSSSSSDAFDENI